ncbi:hypothetical protein BJX76DRAFT_357295 [Aspergillus varians]
MRWNKENEDILWKTAFRIHAFRMDLDRISEAWPGPEKPTPKALKEHLTKYRKTLGDDNKITFGMATNVTSRKRGRSKKSGGDGASGISAPRISAKRATSDKDHALAKALDDVAAAMKAQDDIAAAEEGGCEESEDENGPVSKKIKLEMDDDKFL